MGLIFAWVFSGWPQIWDFPPKAQEVKAVIADLVVTACDVDDVVNSTCFDAISADGGTSYALGKNSHIDAPFQTLSADSVNSATLYYDSWATLTGTWGIYVKDARDGTIICSVDPAPEDASETTNSVACSVTATQLANGVWLQANNNDTKSPEDVNLDFVRLNVDYNVAANNPPSLTVSQPDGVGDTVTAGDSYNITYDLSDAEDVATVDFFYDTNNVGLDGTAITDCQNQPEGTSATCAWNTNGVTAGSYYVYGIADDGVNPTVSDYSPGTITIEAQSITFSISDNAIGFGTLSNTAARFADGTGAGSATEVAAHTLDVSTNAADGYAITVDGNTLASGANTVTAIGPTATDVTLGTGTEQYGIRLTLSGGTGGTVSAPYNGAANNYALDTAAFPDQASSGSGDGTTDTYSVFYAANISNTTEAGSYTSTLTYVATGTF